MNFEKISPRPMTRAGVIVLIVLAVAAVGGVWAVTAQGTVDGPPTPARPIVLVPGEGVPAASCGAFRSGDEGQQRLFMRDFPDCTPPVQAWCPVGATTEQYMPASLELLRFVYGGPKPFVAPFDQICYLLPASGGVPQVGVIQPPAAGNPQP